MKLTVENPNYACTVIRVPKLTDLAGCDNVKGLPIFGFQAIVSKEMEEGSLALAFTAETKLSEEYLFENSLYRHSEKNVDPTKKWYFEDHGRIKAMKFRGHRSSAFVMPIESLRLVLNDAVSPFKEWDVFDTIDWTKICEKFIIERKEQRANKIRWAKKVFDRVEPKLFPEHLDSENYFRNKHQYSDTDRVIITQKLHWTSGRFGNIRVKRRLSFISRLAGVLWIPVELYEYDFIAGSRRVVKDIKSLREFNNFYTDDIWGQALERIKHLIPKDTVIYAEIIGWVGESPIQKNYTYQLPKGTFDIYIYRIATINPDGYSVDYSWDQVRTFCKLNWLKNCPMLSELEHRYFDAEECLDERICDSLALFHDIPVPLDPESPCDEGVCIRKEGIIPYITKAKSPMFYEHETALLDKGEEDIESTQSVTQEYA